MKLSIGFLVASFELRSSGTAGRASLPNDQWSEYFAPSAIQRFSTSV